MSWVHTSTVTELQYILRNTAGEGKNIRRLQNLVHALGAKCALYQITNGNGADEGAEAGILALLLGCALLEDLGWAERGLTVTPSNVSGVA